MNIFSQLILNDEKIANAASSINPDNYVNQKVDNGPNIVSTIEINKIVYKFNRFQSINTLRLTLDDLLTHFNFALKIEAEFEKK